MIDSIRRLCYGKLVGITGGAGSGKSTLASKLGFTTYHVDSFFIGDSDYRKMLLSSKSKNIDSYIDSCNMYNWWNWGDLEAEVDAHREEYETLVVEGALLGSEWLLDKLDIIIFILDSQIHRFGKLIKRDSHKRSFSEMLERFMITEFSESLYYKNMIDKFSYKIVTIDDEYRFLNFIPEIKREQIVPMKVVI